MNNLKGIGIIGPTCCGKNEVASTITRYIGTREKTADYRPRTFSTKDKYDALSKAIYYRNSDETVRRDLRLALETISPGTFVGSLFYGAMLFKDRSNDERTPVAIINSIETQSQAEQWKELIPDFHFIYVESDLETRLHNHNLYRTDPHSAEQFLKLCEINDDERIGAMKGLATPTNIAINIGVDTGLKTLREGVHKILDRIL